MKSDLPSDEIEASQWDGWLNRMIKSIRGQKGYIVPNEEMLMHWLKHYCGANDADIVVARERYKAMVRADADF